MGETATPDLNEIAHLAQSIIGVVHTEIIEKGGRLTQAEDDDHRLVGPQTYQRIVKTAIRIRDEARKEGAPDGRDSDS